MTKKRERRFWSANEKRGIVAQTLTRDVSVSQVARRYDVNANLVYKWLRDPRFCPGEEDAARFLPVEVVSDPVIPMVDPGEPAGTFEIVLHNGHRLNVSGAFDPDAVARLVRGLAG